MTKPRLMTLLAVLALTIGLMGCSSDNAPTTPQNNHLMTFDPDARAATSVNPIADNGGGSDPDFKLANQGLEALFTSDDKALPPCITITDTRGYIWTINRNFGELNGTVLLPDGCGEYQFTGTSFFLSAWSDAPPAGCCESITYFVEFLDIPNKVAAGTWFDSCGNSGDWATVETGACK